MGYAKLFSAITKSSLWSEPKEVRLLFVSMLAEADEQGFVEAAIPGLARIANLTIQEITAALEVLTSPDPYSKDQANEGRRVARVDGGWRLLNYSKYKSRHEEAEAHQQRARDAQERASLTNFTAYSMAFTTAWSLYPKHGRNRRIAAAAAWNQAIEVLRQRFGDSIPKAEDWLTERIRAFGKSAKGQGSFAPGMTTFLSDGRYDDDADSWDKVSTSKANEERESRYQEMPPIQ